MRQLGFVDRCIGEIDMALRAICVPKYRSSTRANPAANLSETPFIMPEKRHVAGLMRVNHVGEVCAQALYQGQALTARFAEIKAHMAKAAAEEIDHLAWCEQRLEELESHPSRLNLVWYSGAFIIGAVAGFAGDQWSLGFVVETERQVGAHLTAHLQQLPAYDCKTKAILTQMHEDEAQHAELAMHAGAAELPSFIKCLMRGAAKVMTWTSYYI